jgi:hypothetical protein
MQFPYLQLPDTEAAFVQEGIHSTFHLVHASAAARTPAEASLSAAGKLRIGREPAANCFFL